jgi:signal peptidase I
MHSRYGLPIALVGTHPRRTAGRVAALVLGASVTFGVVLLPVRLSGISMQPTYDSGELNFANRWAYVWNEPARGDVIAIRLAGRRAVYVKRIVGLPGERIEIASGVVKVDGRPLEEQTVVYRAPWTMLPVSLGPDEYFVIGDHRAMKMENHDFGRVGRGRVVGKLLF